MNLQSPSKDKLIQGLQETLHRLEQNQLNLQECKEFALDLQAYETMAEIRSLELSALNDCERLQVLLKSLVQ